ncbi:MAG: gamma carbonic anhydrase family protein [Deltaproteobacteria bacterium]|nr:gamma carbonic anhydrase family protein [Deltaproteobacteria bacterium]
MALRPFQGRMPAVDPSAFIEQSAQVIGDVTVGARSSIWFNAVVRGDVHFIRVGSDTNVQDLCCLHVTRDKHSLVVGDRVTLGQGVTLHGCVVEDDCLVGMGAIVLDGARLGRFSLIGAGALVTPGTQIPPYSLAIGSPARVKRAITDEERARIESSAAHYVGYAEQYR